MCIIVHQKSLCIFKSVGYIVFFTGLQKILNKFNTLGPTKSNSYEDASATTVQSIELKFSTCIIGVRPTKFINFGEVIINTFFSGVQK